MGRCCVQGCNIVNEDTTYFEFPVSRALRRKWLDAIKCSSNVSVGTVVCSRHFAADHCERVRGKLRLKRRVTPSVLLTQEELQAENPIPDTTTPPSGGEVAPPPPIQTPTEPHKSPTSQTTPDPPPSPVKEPDRVITPIDNVKSSVTIDDRIKDVSKRKTKCKDKESIKDSGLPTPEIQPDFEEMITNYQIKNSKPNALRASEREDVPVVCEGDDTIVVEDKEHAPPVFIEIPVDKDNSTSNSVNEDCLMVLESVQIEVDPSTLLLHERDYDSGTEQDNNTNSAKKDDPISLLTSSDEEEVIIQEPHIDTVEVSDETDEDDMPLVKLVNQPKLSKKPPKAILPEDFSRLMWSGTYGYYCIKCHYTASTSYEYTAHLQEHERVIQVCSVCNYSTPSKAQFARHVKKHKDEKKYKCDICEYKARHNMSLIYHMQSHNEKGAAIVRVKDGFKCAKCGFSARSKSAVVQHLKVCVKAKIYRCDMCKYTAKRKFDLKRHLKKHDLVGDDSDASYKPEWGD